MTDQSNLDKKYIIDNHVYNCPFCKRNNVVYELDWPIEFDWSSTKTCWIFILQCSSCKKKSIHLSFTNIPHRNPQYYSDNQFSSEIEDIDSFIFFSIPSSFFVLDSRIPNILRELFDEAQKCLQNNLLTGASVCARKLIYELAKKEGASGNNYDERIKDLKRIKKSVDPEYFDTLLTIQQITSDKVHEDSYDGWQSNHIKLILATLLEILNEIYVIPKIKQEKRNSILELKETIIGNKKTK